MLNARITIRVVSLLTLVLALSAAAQAQATRTWVSGVGDDVNPCSRTAPCKTFAGAISKTADKGEINAIDPGGFGAITIVKSITIDGAGAHASILAAGTNGVIVNDSTNAAVVRLRNLSINGANSGLNGIRFLAGKRLYVESCAVFGFKGSGTNSHGIDFSPTAAGLTFNLDVKDSTFEECGGDGIRLFTTSGTINASVDHSVLSGNNNGLNVLGGTGNVSSSVIDNNLSNGLTVSNGAFLNASDNQITSNGTGINNNSSNVRIGGNRIYRNTTGLAQVGGTYNSFGNNLIFGNNNDGVAPPITNPK